MHHRATPLARTVAAAMVAVAQATPAPATKASPTLRIAPKVRKRLLSTYVSANDRLLARTAEICPNGASFSAKPYAAQTAHQAEECSGRGICDRRTGMCKCLSGFDGSACHRVTCPNSCNGHGFCKNIAYLALEHGGPSTQSLHNHAQPHSLLFAETQSLITLFLACHLC